jgi:outer membrane biosynthesis protein TonB
MPEEAIGLDEVQRASSEAERAREAELEERRGRIAPERTIFVRATRAEIPVVMPDGRVITTAGMDVPADNVFIARRIRDRSLESLAARPRAEVPPPPPPPEEQPQPQAEAQPQPEVEAQPQPEVEAQPQPEAEVAGPAPAPERQAPVFGQQPQQPAPTFDRQPQQPQPSDEGAFRRDAEEQR